MYGLSTYDRSVKPLLLQPFSSVGSISHAAEQQPAILVTVMSHESLIVGRSRIPHSDRAIGAANTRRAERGTMLSFDLLQAFVQRHPSKVLSP